MRQPWLNFTPMNIRVVSFNIRKKFRQLDYVRQTGESADEEDIPRCY